MSRPSPQALASVLAALLMVAGLSPIAQAAPAPAVTLVQQATAAYRAGRYVAAAELFIGAFELSKSPIQLRNAAKAYMKDARWVEAEATWARYAQQPGLTGAERSEASAEVRSIKERQSALQAKAAAAQAQAAADLATAEAKNAKHEAQQARLDRPAPSRMPGYVVAGIGAAAVLASAILFVHGNSRLSTLDEALATKDGEGKITGITGASAQSELSGINSERTASAALLGLGLAAGVGGAILWGLAGPSTQDLQASVGPTSGGAFGQLTLRF